MDTSVARGSQPDIQAQIAEIRQYMPMTYDAIQARAKEVGNGVYAQVRKGLRGEANQFYAMESGRVVGTPFAIPDVTAELAQAMVRFGVRFMVVWGRDVEGAGHGTH